MTKGNSLRPLFIFGCYRSGTSLLRLILNAHPNIFIPEETQFIPHIGKVINKYGNLEKQENLNHLLRDICSLLRRKARWEKLPSPKRIKSFLPQKPNYADVIRGVILSMVDGDIKDLKYWGDKTPKYINSFQYLSQLYPDAKFINIIRDGRDVAASVKKEPFWGGRTPLMVAEEWNYRILNGLLGEISLGKKRFFTVQYERLVSNPETTLKEITDFLDIDFDKSMLMFYKTPSAKELSRFARHKNVMKPISTASVGRYKTVLTKKEIRIFENEAGNSLLALGYPVNPSSLIAVQTTFKLYDFLFRVINGTMHRIAVRIKPLSTYKKK